MHFFIVKNANPSRLTTYPHPQKVKELKSDLRCSQIYNLQICQHIVPLKVKRMKEKHLLTIFRVNLDFDLNFSRLCSEKIFFCVENYFDSFEWNQRKLRVSYSCQSFLEKAI